MITSKDDKWLIKIVETLLSPLESSGEHRRERWEDGWQQNIDEKSIIPHYFGKYPVVRKGGKFVEAKKGFEYQQLLNLEKEVFTEYFKHSVRIFEFGCGTGHNLVTLQNIFPQAYLTGLDWVGSSMRNVESLGFKWFMFDMFNPSDVKINRGAVLTVAAMEQLGNNFYQFVNYLVEQKPQICVHLEPIEELMNPDNLLDHLQLQYMRKRQYLSGFLSYLQQLERAGLVEILEASRNGVGSLFIEGYSLIVWRPKS